ncbi:polysaccharide biosynthesis protein [Vibrio anguillarum]|uniref:lipopolysaccharide biosynthesis protein n=2 Tax=Vibrio anguillarum TaxID=55601 RepID=UPI000B7BF670|nr:MATE family efflux transporter [Vibrio anguillarum]ASO27819.1 polysaccharide biosynthesis protein [Vibrio anguillarum]
MTNKKILKNTLALYFRQIIIILITLYSMRVILNELGVEDFGVYSVVAGFVTLLAFLPGSMASATQRFFSFAMGKKDIVKLKQTFSVNLVMYACIALFAYTIFQTIGLWYIDEHLKIPDSRFNAALELYHYVSLSFVFSIFSAPFIAILIAHEDMHLYAILSVIDAILKLAAAISLAYVSYDLLAYYGVALLIISALLAFAYILICLKKYPECQMKKLYWSTGILKEIMGFTVWTLLGQLSTVFRNQAVTVLVNQMFNPSTVAARAIALNVASQVGIFSNNLNTGLYPPIIKAYAANQKEEMLNLVFNGSKLTFFLMWVCALPMLLEMETILTLWLKTPPEEAILFTQLAIVESLILAISMPLTTAARAPGKIAVYEIILGTIQIAIFFVSWWFLNLGYSAEWVFYIAIAANIVMFKVRLLLVNYLTDLPIMAYYQRVVVPVLSVLVISSLLSLLLLNNLPKNLYASLLVIIFSISISILTMYFLGLDKYWREKVVGILTNKFFKSREVR